MLESLSMVEAARAVSDYFDTELNLTPAESIPGLAGAIIIQANRTTDPIRAIEEAVELLDTATEQLLDSEEREEV